MKIALVASSYLPNHGGLERHVDELARGLSGRGVAVEVLTQHPSPRLPPVSDFDGFVVRRFVTLMGNTHIGVAPSLWERLRRTATSFDLVHAHSSHVPLALAVARSHPRRFVFTPQAPVPRFLRWPYVRVTQALINQGARFICTTAVERELLYRRFPEAADRIEFIPHGLDIAAIKAARPFAYPGTVVLAVGRLERHKRIDGAIAAMAALGPAFRLAVVGDGPARQKLLAHAADLRVSSRVKFLGSLPDAELYRWLRTARVVVALAQEDSSALPVTEALAAEVPVVASDIPVHREAVSYAGGGGVRFVSPTASPLEIADAIYEAAEFGRPEFAELEHLTWDQVVERTLETYTAAIRGGPRVTVTAT